MARANLKIRRGPGTLVRSVNRHLRKARTIERATRASSSPLHYCRFPQPASIMEKLLIVVFVSSLLLLATLADNASSRSSLRPSPLDTQRGHVLSRKGREERAYPHYRPEGELKEQHEVSSYVPLRLQCRENRVSCVHINS
jgi:hypothetical protein